jgi:phosphoglycerate dehydrogenase-like enzyme
VCSSDLIRSATHLKVIACYGVGYDRVDTVEATAHGVVVTNSAGANAAAVAELTVGLILTLARRLTYANESVRKGEWPIIDGIGIRGKTVGLVGLGAIGREVARRMKAFDCRLLAYDPYVGSSMARQFLAEFVPLDEVLRVSDFVSLHIPVTSATKGMVDRSFLRRMKRGAFLINTARGDLVDEVAVAENLRSGWLRGAAFDCLTREPPEAENPLLSLPQVIITPHIGAQTDEALNRMGWMALDNCLTVLRGEVPINVVNPDVLNGLTLSKKTLVFSPGPYENDA